MLNYYCYAFLQLTTLLSYTHCSIQLQGMRKDYSLFIFVNFNCIYRYSSIKIKLELKKKILKIGYGVNYKYDGMLAHSFDRFYVVTKFILPSIKVLKFCKFYYESTCAYLDENNIGTAENKKYILDLLVYSKKIRPYIDYYK